MDFSFSYVEVHDVMILSITCPPTNQLVKKINQNFLNCDLQSAYKRQLFTEGLNSAVPKASQAIQDEI